MKLTLIKNGGSLKSLGFSTKSSTLIVADIIINLRGSPL